MEAVMNKGANLQVEALQGLPELYCERCGAKLVPMNPRVYAHDPLSGKSLRRVTLRCPSVKWWNLQWTSHDQYNYCRRTNGNWQRSVHTNGSC